MTETDGITADPQRLIIHMQRNVNLYPKLPGGLAANKVQNIWNEKCKFNQSKPNHSTGLAAPCCHT